MTQDVLVKQDESGVFDLRVDGADFAHVDGMETAIVVSLFTDARAPDSVVKSAKNRRGWVGDILTANVGRTLGSLLWTYDQSRLTRDILNRLDVTVENALKWMVDDGIAREISAEVTQDSSRGIIINIDILTPDGKNQKYAILWKATKAANV